MLEDTWAALADVPGSQAPDLEALESWLARNQERLGDPLALAAALDRLRNERACTACREALRAQLWSELERPAPRAPRRAGDEAGARYLEALDPEDGE